MGPDPRYNGKLSYRMRSSQRIANLSTKTCRVRISSNGHLAVAITPCERRYSAYLEVEKGEAGLPEFSSSVTCLANRWSQDHVSGMHMTASSLAHAIPSGSSTARMHP